MNIREIRKTTGLTQKEFADLFNIPIGTVRRWEYGESTPAPYLIRLIAERLPVENKYLFKIDDGSGNTFYYNKLSGEIMDKKGTKIIINEDLEEVKLQNLQFYVKDLFETYYEMIDKFNQKCRLDKEEDIIWS